MEFVNCRPLLKHVVRRFLSNHVRSCRSQIVCPVYRVMHHNKGRCRPIIEQNAHPTTWTTLLAEKKIRRSFGTRHSENVAMDDGKFLGLPKAKKSCIDTKLAFGLRLILRRRELMHEMPKINYVYEYRNEETA